MMNKCTIYTVLHSYPYVQVTVFNTVLEHNLCIYQLYEYFSQKQFIKWIVLKNVKLLNITPVSLKLLKLIFPGPISRGNLGVTVYRKWFQKTSPRELSLIPVCGIKATLTQRLTVFPVWFSVVTVESHRWFATLTLSIMKEFFRILTINPLNTERIFPNFENDHVATCVKDILRMSFLKHVATWCQNVIAFKGLKIYNTKIALWTK